MQSYWKWSAVNGRTRLVLILALLSILGCGRGGPRTHSIKGKVELASGDVKLLAGSFVEAALISDSNVRSSGVIQPDGSFKLGTLHAGSVVNGAGEGKYQVRILLADDDNQAYRQAVTAIAPRFLDFRRLDCSSMCPLARTLRSNFRHVDPSKFSERSGDECLQRKDKNDQATHPHLHAPRGRRRDPAISVRPNR